MFKVLNICSVQSINCLSVFDFSHSESIERVALTAIVLRGSLIVTRLAALKAN